MAYYPKILLRTRFWNNKFREDIYILRMAKLTKVREKIFANGAKAFREKPVNRVNSRVNLSHWSNV